MIRPLKFAAVGLTCLCLQLTILYLLEDSLTPLLANCIGFFASAQLNFALSYNITWNDSSRRAGKQLLYTWLRFMGNVTLGLGTNSALFALVHTASGVPSLVAAGTATVFSTICTFLINNRLVFRPERGVP
jgi:putative flippase GtrA